MYDDVCFQTRVGKGPTISNHLSSNITRQPYAVSIKCPPVAVASVGAPDQNFKCCLEFHSLRCNICVYQKEPKTGFSIKKQPQTWTQTQISKPNTNRNPSMWQQREDRSAVTYKDSHQTWVSKHPSGDWGRIKLRELFIQPGANNCSIHTLAQPSWVVVVPHNRILRSSVIIKNCFIIPGFIGTHCLLLLFAI